MKQIVPFVSSRITRASLVGAALATATLGHANAAVGGVAEGVLDALPAVLVGVAGAMLAVVGVITAIKYIRRLM
jgi:type IV secretory pathway VirB2 component (pilin)